MSDVLLSLVCQLLVILAESFYYVNYGSSIITSKVSQIISVIENIGVSFVFKTKRELKCDYFRNIILMEAPVFMFSSLILFDKLLTVHNCHCRKTLL